MRAKPTSVVIKRDILAYLYSKPNAALRTRMEEILKAHATATGEGNFLYKGKLYGQRTRVAAKPLTQSDLSDQMADLLDTDRSLNAEKMYVDSYITAILNMSTHASTYLQLFPTAVHDIIRRHATDGFAEELTEERIEAALKYNRKGEQLLKQRILKNTVMD